MPLEAIAPGLVQRCRTLSPLLRFPLAGVVTFAAFFSRLTLLADYLPPGLPFLNLFLSTLLSASLFGRGPGMFSVLLGGGMVAWFVSPPIGAFSIADPKHMTALALFSLIAGLLVHVIGQLQDALAQVRVGEDHLRLLLREFRHRTRNDLHSLVGLLLLRARGAHSADAREALREASGHALALARVHTRLTTASPGYGEEAVVDSREFILGLVEDLQRSTAGDGLRPVAVIAEAESHVLNNERAVQLGLVLNELVTNALKYAFPNEDVGGSVWVRFERQGAEYVLTVADDGEGLPVEGDVPQPSRLLAGLGTRLLRALASQLRGSFTRQTGPGERGCVAVLRFPVVAPTILPMPAAA